MAMHDVLFSIHIHIIFLRNENKHIEIKTIEVQFFKKTIYTFVL